MIKTPTEYQNLVYRIEQLAREVTPDLDDPRRVHLSSAQAHLVMAAGCVQQVANYNPLKKAAGK